MTKQKRWHTAVVVDGRVYVSAKSYTLWVALEKAGSTEEGKTFKRPYIFGWTRLMRQARIAFNWERA